MKYFSLMTSNRVVGYGKLRSGASVPTSVFAVFRTEICRLRNVCLKTLLGASSLGDGMRHSLIFFHRKRDGSVESCFCSEVIDDVRMRKGNYSRNIGEKMKKVRFCVRRRSFVLIMGIGLMMGFAAFERR